MPAAMRFSNYDLLTLMFALGRKIVGTSFFGLISGLSSDVLDADGDPDEDGDD